jgi:hypothetical protein
MGALNRRLGIKRTRRWSLEGLDTSFLLSATACWNAGLRVAIFRILLPISIRCGLPGRLYNSQLTFA